MTGLHIHWNNVRNSKLNHCFLRDYITEQGRFKGFSFFLPESQTVVSNRHVNMSLLKVGPVTLKMSS